MISGNISACIIIIDFFLTIRKSGNHFVRNSCGLSFTSCSKLSMRDNGHPSILYIYIFICISVLTTWQLIRYFILIFMFLFDECIDKLLGDFRITFDNHLLLGILEIQFFLPFSFYYYYFVIWRLLFLAFVWQLCLISTAVLLSTVVMIKSQQEKNSAKASLKLFVSSPCKLSQPVESFNNASVPEYIRLIMSIFWVNYVHGSDTKTRRQIEANCAKTPPAQYNISSESTWKP